MKKVLLYFTLPIFIIATGSCHTTKTAMESTRPCQPEDTKYLNCEDCADSLYQGAIFAVTVEGLMAHRNKDKCNLFIFVNSLGEAFRELMPPCVYVATHVDTIVPELVLMDSYKGLPKARSKVIDWGWGGDVDVLDQAHYGCYDGLGFSRNATLLHEFGIEETPEFCHSMFMAVLIGKDGTILGYSNYIKLPWTMTKRSQQ